MWDSDLNHLTRQAGAHPRLLHEASPCHTLRRALQCRLPSRCKASSSRRVGLLLNSAAPGDSLCSELGHWRFPSKSSVPAEADLPANSDMQHLSHASWYALLCSPRGLRPAAWQARSSDSGPLPKHNSKGVCHIAAAQILQAQDTGP